MEDEPGHIGEGNKAWQKSQDILVRVMRYD